MAYLEADQISPHVYKFEFQAVYDPIPQKYMHDSHILQQLCTRLNYSLGASCIFMSSDVVEAVGFVNLFPSLHRGITSIPM